MHHDVAGMTGMMRWESATGSEDGGAALAVRDRSASAVTLWRRSRHPPAAAPTFT